MEEKVVQIAKSATKIWSYQKIIVLSGFSAVGSAHVWGARGRWFESSNPDRKRENREIPSFFC